MSKASCGNFSCPSLRMPEASCGNVSCPSLRMSEAPYGNVSCPILAFSIAICWCDSFQFAWHEVESRSMEGPFDPHTLLAHNIDYLKRFFLASNPQTLTLPRPTTTYTARRKYWHVSQHRYRPFNATCPSDQLEECLIINDSSWSIMISNDY